MVVDCVGKLDTPEKNPQDYFSVHGGKLQKLFPNAFFLASSNFVFSSNFSSSDIASEVSITEFASKKKMVGNPNSTPLPVVC